ncbi:hypothetical protein TVAG_047840 [Trichomonas vaginalis G3]|uniref:Uncharacterized protein n=1 Tax=Trichomonas vaginalis (strain ATCC PRA-98 / G3) TaxID=412133 RepID=A2FAA9_TRIV3|nr:hypothetical protein TVAGG3_0485730 [Trichomonas vaginalis G3]EAX98183.1 hypothetical protein TVAG_047840 [Trichomonas vaginalis G3]KAI5516031.1 hypothetical protein TVAGG3_0485730 [Trichomonas vaginalis G3]|eukprot:XP_001311113.1 hypothetical protein [Trichomonas vaginalis G3]
MENTDIEHLREKIELAKIKIESGLRILRIRKEEMQYQLEIIRQMETGQYKGQIERINDIYRFCGADPGCGMSITDLINSKIQNEKDKIKQMDAEIIELQKRFEKGKEVCKNAKNILSELKSRQTKIFNSQVIINQTKNRYKSLFAQVSKLNFYQDKIEMRKKETEILKKQLRFLDYKPDMKRFNDVQPSVRPSQTMNGVKDYKTAPIVKNIHDNQHIFEKQMSFALSFNPHTEVSTILNKSNKSHNSSPSKQQNTNILTKSPEELALLKQVEEQNQRIKEKQAQFDAIKEKYDPYLDEYNKYQSLDPIARDINPEKLANLYNDLLKRQKEMREEYKGKINKVRIAANTISTIKQTRIDTLCKSLGKEPIKLPIEIEKYEPESSIKDI